ncbi:hypothetical protein M8542_11100 [Amycolatopsis sp. OK19-0408]|uniref:Uncharacterized protein n=1 Tax=Amycolatopsis iheyensis TaxID=2945988 RepID=A0A9X2NA77_9PSEU|nr:hypothetical protein [Amycolatopsis iheyensis]MCR6483365.1 hypothetical protein [Amycolatopsis iheyensis]
MGEAARGRRKPARHAWLGSKQDRKQFRKQQKRRARKPGRRWWVFAVFVAILGVTTAAIVLVGRRPAKEAAPPNPTSVPRYAHVDLARPYLNTPADAWPKGLDGITTPSAGTAEAAAYAKVKQAIAAARLEPAVLTGHDAKGFLGLLAPDFRDQLTGVFARKPAKGTASWDSYLTELADGYHLLDAGPRSFGTLTAHPGAKAGELAVDAKYVIAYAFDNVHPEGLTSPSEIVSFLRVDETYVLRSGKNFTKGSQGLWLDGGSSAFSAVGCAAAREGYLAPGYANPPSVAGTGGDQDAPGYYDPKYPVPTLDGCPA